MMEISNFDLLKSYAETEEFPLVICDTEFRIQFLNNIALKNYEKYGGSELIGKSLLPLLDEEARSKVDMIFEWFKESREHNRILAVHHNYNNTDVYICALRDSEGKLIGICSRHRSRNKDQNTPYENID